MHGKGKGASLDLTFADEQAASDDFAVDGDTDDAYRWNGDYWAESRDYDEGKLALDWLATHAPEKATDNLACALARAARKRARPLPVPDRRRVVIPMRGSYLHLERGEDGRHAFRVAAPDRAEGMTYGIDAKCPVADGDRWTPQPRLEGTRLGAFLERVLPDAGVREVVQEYFGTTFLPDARHHKALVLIGRGRNGKGTLIRLLRRGHRRTVAVDANRLDGFALEGAESASLVIADEVKERGLASQDLKKCISGEPIQVNRKGRKVITVELTAKWVLTSNHLPKLDDMTRGMLSRLLFVPMEATIDPKEIVANLDDDIADNELALFIEWCLAGLLRVSDRGRLPTDEELPEPCRALKDTVKQASCSVLEWVDDIGGVVKDEAVLTVKMEIWRAYREWTESRGGKAFGEKAFWERMVQHLALPADYQARRTDALTKKKIGYVRLIVPGVSHERVGATDFD